MNTPLDATARGALEFQAQQLRMIIERLSSVRELLPRAGIDWRGPAQELFDAGVLELHRDLAQARTLVETAEHRTMLALQQMGSYVG
ncbi:hypothetical protein I6E81_08325 [Salinibacterium sp. NG22]|uniref:hypothetical protein n=1 Tax=Salinibacterium sp. NG22 TaxID=2792040 RepID=UPI0018CE4160|nr:hypothetical protein [Salinibacterium sp. NG22]MBH0110172.1 hypothetical protein [Salinibacterium sp. NG22]